MTNEYPGKKKFQKLVYLIENLGNVNLGFKYGIHFYGPYSSKLDDTITKLNGEGFLTYEYQGGSHLICMEEGVSLAADDEFFKPDLSEDEIAAMKEVLKKFSKRNPADLELLTTAHYAHSHLNDKSENRVIAGVQKIKGSKFSEAEIKNAINELNLTFEIA